MLLLISGAAVTATTAATAATAATLLYASLYIERGEEKGKKE